jgi:fatty acid desaturase
MSAAPDASAPTRAELLASLDRSPDLAYSLFHLSAAWGQLGSLIALRSIWPAGLYGELLYVLAMGWSQYRIYFPLHEACHGTLFRSARANRLAGSASAALLFSAFDSFTHIHMEHHRTWGSREDPGAVDYFVRFRSRWQLAAFLLSPLFGVQLAAKLWENLGRPAVAWRRARGRSAPRHSARQAAPRKALFRASDALWLGAVQLGVFLAITGLGARPLDYLWAYLLPGATVFLFLARLRMYLEHGPVDYAVSDYLGANARRIARTHASNWLERPLFSYMNFRLHQEHHLFPSLPSVRLPEVYRRYTASRLDPDDYSPSYTRTLLRVCRLP